MARSTSSVREQIEATADYVPPDTYARLLFGQNAQFPISYDTASTDFIPVTGVTRNPKMFVVGVIPPSADVTGKLLDRSASVANRTEAGTGQAYSGADTPTSGNIFISDDPTAPTSQGLDAEYWKSYVQMCQRLGVDPKDLAAVLNAESGMKSGAENLANGKDKPPVAKGLNQLIWDTARGLGMDRATWDEYQTYTPQQQLPWVEKFFSKGGGIKGASPARIYQRNFGGVNKDGTLYANKAAQDAYLASKYPPDQWEAERKRIYPNAAYQEKAIAQNPGLVGKSGRGNDGRITLADLAANIPSLPGSFAAGIDQALASGGGPPPPASDPSKKAAAEKATDFAGDGSANAAKSKQEGSKTQGKDLNTTELGKRYQAAQQAEILATQFLLESMRNTPPLRFLVNPSSFKVGMEKIINDGNWTRNGPIIEHWGDGQDKLDFSGKIAAFMALDANSPRPDESGGGPGLTRVARNYSASYHNFLSLWMFYRNNGGIFNTFGGSTTATGTTWSRMSMVGTVYIYYDDIIYFGSFDSFSITEEDTAPYTLSYNIQFTVRATFLLDTPPDPREGSYGPQGLSSSSRLPTSSPLTASPTQKQVTDPQNDQLRDEAIKRRDGLEPR